MKIINNNYWRGWPGATTGGFKKKVNLVLSIVIAATNVIVVKDLLPTQFFKDFVDYASLAYSRGTFDQEMFARLLNAARTSP